MRDDQPPHLHLPPSRSQSSVDRDIYIIYIFSLYSVFLYLGTVEYSFLSEVLETLHF